MNILVWFNIVILQLGAGVSNLVLFNTVYMWCATTLPSLSQGNYRYLSRGMG